MNEQQNTFIPKNAAYFRAKARAALKGLWGTAILALLLAFICGAFNENIFPSKSKLENLFGFRFNDMMSLDFYTIENLRALLARFLSALPTLLLTGTIFWTLFAVAWKIFIGAPVRLGYEKFNLGLIDAAKPTISTLFDGFRAGYFQSVVVRVLLFLIKLACSLPLIIASVFISPIAKNFGDGAVPSPADALVLLLCLLVICALTIFKFVMQLLVKLRYSCAYRILAEYPEISAIDALRKSASLMRGNKWRLFCLWVSFIGWFLLIPFTCFIGTLWVFPYFFTAQTAFYDEIANRRAAKAAEFPSLDPDDYNNTTPTF